jgi:chemotaxis methyl-accepting protein methylase
MPEVSTNFANTSIPTRNGFCRQENLNTAAFVLNAAQIREQQNVGPDTMWNITELPCSAGMETWSIAAGLAIQGMGEFHIRAHDLNRNVLKETAQPYKTTRAKLGLAFMEWGLPHECVEFFTQVDRDHVEPRRELRGKVTFSPLDASTQVPEKAHVIITNNLFGNLYPDASEQVAPIVKNIAASLEDGGVFTANDAWHSPQTLARIKSAGLQPVRSKKLQPTDSRYPEFFQKRAPLGPLGFLRKSKSL